MHADRTRRIPASFTKQQRTNAFYIQSPRLQNDVAICISENVACRVSGILH